MSDLQPRQTARTEGPRAVVMAAVSGAAAATTTGWAAVEAEAGGAEGGAGEDAIDISDSGVRVARGEGGEGVELGAAGRAASRERAQLQGALLQGAQLQAELQGALAEERRGAVALRGQAAALVAARDSARVETAAMRRAVRAAVSEGRRETASLKAEELRDEVTKLRYELELARVREGIDCRDAAATALAALRHQFEAYVTRADERLGGEGNFDQGRTSGSVHRSEVLSGGDGGGGGGGDGGGGDGGGDGGGVSSAARVSEELAAMWQRMLREFGSTSRTLRGQLLREAPSAPPPPLDSAAAASRLWLQSSLAQVYPGHLVCVFDPAAADDEQQSAWHIVSASQGSYDPGATPQVAACALHAHAYMSTLYLHGICIAYGACSSLCRRWWHARLLRSLRNCPNCRLHPRLHLVNWSNCCPDCRPESLCAGGV